jgi:predicted peptidase
MLKNFKLFEEAIFRVIKVTPLIIDFLKPSDYDPNPKQYPVHLFLHGAGERGSDNTSQLTSWR